MAEACAALGGPPHLILAADVIYRVETFAPLVSTLAALCDASSADERRPAGEKAEVLFAYRPRVEDQHFWHMLGVEFTATALAPPAALMQQAHGAAQGQVTGGPMHDGDPTTPTRIYRLRRRVARQPTTCRDCMLRNAVAAKASAAMAKAGQKAW